MPEPPPPSADAALHQGLMGILASELRSGNLTDGEMTQLQKGRSAVQLRAVGSAVVAGCCCALIVKRANPAFWKQRKLLVNCLLVVPASAFALAEGVRRGAELALTEQLSLPNSPLADKLLAYTCAHAPNSPILRRVDTSIVRALHERHGGEFANGGGGTDDGDAAEELLSPVPAGDGGLATLASEQPAPAALHRPDLSRAQWGEQQSADAGAASPLVEDYGYGERSAEQREQPTREERLKRGRESAGDRRERSRRELLLTPPV